jgi:predicted nucleic acid-binding protein
MNIAVDTNRYTDFLRGDPTAALVFQHASALFVPLFAAAEIRAGFQHGRRPAENEKTFAEFLHRPGVSLLMPDEETTRHYATLYAQLRRQATPISINDLWIAALVVQHKLTLFTRDAHFDHLPQVPRL